MKKFLSNKKTTIILLAVTVVMLAFYVYMIARPISYKMGYHTETVYEGVTFEGTLKFYADETMTNSNTNFEEEMEYRYYYKDGYVFSVISETDEDFAKEVDYINENFEEAVDTPFYASKINAFRYVAEGPDGYKEIYTCMPAIIFAIVAGAVELILIGFTCSSFILRKKEQL